MMISFNHLIPAILTFLVVLPLAQDYDSEANHIKSSVTQSDVEFNIYFLASDEFLGRDTGTQELKIASRYIATWFQVNGVQKVDGQDSFFQDVPLRRFSSPDVIELSVGDSTFLQNTHLIALINEGSYIEAPYIYLEYATEEEIRENDVEGKIIITQAGLPGQTSPQQFFSSIPEKLARVQDAGGLAVIELYSSSVLPWEVLVGYLGGDQMELDDGSEISHDQIPVLWMNGTADGVRDYLSAKDNTDAVLRIDVDDTEIINSRNVIGIIEGTDPDLKDEYIILSAHYDHVGVVPGQTEGNYIYNGARDNAVGTAGVLAAAKYLSENPPRRSVIFAAWTAEEVGLLGSRWYAENPLIPLEQTVFNLNIDGAGYNDTTKVTVIGLGRTDADEEMVAAARAFGLEAISDPVPEQNLFNRSDNFSLAIMGVPAPTYSMGLTEFDDEINYYYHQVTDEPHTIDYNYVTQYIRSFILAARKIANRDVAPFWNPGDVFEEAGLELYEKVFD